MLTGHSRSSAGAVRCAWRLCPHIASARSPAHTTLAPLPAASESRPRRKKERKSHRMLYFRYRLGRDVYTLYTVQALVYRLQHRFGDYIQLYCAFLRTAVPPSEYCAGNGTGSCSWAGICTVTRTNSNDSSLPTALQGTLNTDHTSCPAQHCAHLINIILCMRGCVRGMLWCVAWCGCPIQPCESSLLTSFASTSSTLR